ERSRRLRASRTPSRSSPTTRSSTSFAIARRDASSSWGGSRIRVAKKAIRRKPRPVALYRELRAAMRGVCAVPRGSRILVACSGGPDSLALLIGLSELAKPLGFEIAVAHLDHGTRGAASRGDARAVERRARALGVPFVLGEIDSGLLMKTRKLS